MKFILDSNIYDRIVATPGMTETLQDLCEIGQIEIIKTHIQEDELGLIPDAYKREQTKIVPGKKVPTSGSVWGISKWGEGTWGSGSGNIRISDIQKGNPKYNKDALIATTAAESADVLVTDEKRTLPNRIKATCTRLKVWDFPKFKEYIYSLKNTI
jgi:hypothetical protein